jgi:hypothetical protein
MPDGWNVVFDGEKACCLPAVHRLQPWWDMWPASLAQEMAGDCALAADPYARLCRVDILDAAERELLSHGWNDSASDVPTTTPLPGGLKPRRRTRMRFSVICGVVQLAYRLLDAPATPQTPGQALSLPGGAWRVTDMTCVLPRTIWAIPTSHSVVLCHS